MDGGSVPRTGTARPPGLLSGWRGGFVCRYTIGWGGGANKKEAGMGEGEN